MFFERFRQLCDEKGISIYKAAIEIGLNRASATKWKGGSVPNGQTLSKLADFFGVSIGYLLGEETERTPVASDKRSISDDEIKFALFGGGGGITDAMLDEVLSFAAFVKRREEEKKKQEQQ